MKCPATLALLRSARPLLICLAFVGVATPASAGTPCELFEGGRRDEELLSQLLATDPAVSPCTSLYAGLLQRERQRVGEAIVSLQRGRDHHPFHFPMAFELAISLSWDGRLEEAKGQFEAAARLAPESVAAAVGVARIMAWQGKLREAERRYRFLSQRHPEDLDVLNGLAFVLRAKSRFSGARELYEQVLHSDPGNGDALEGLAALQSASRLRLEASVGTTNDSTKATVGQLTYQLHRRLSVAYSYSQNSFELQDPLLATSVDEEVLQSSSTLGVRALVGSQATVAASVENRELRGEELTFYSLNGSRRFGERSLFAGLRFGGRGVARARVGHLGFSTALSAKAQLRLQTQVFVSSSLAGQGIAAVASLQAQPHQRLRTRFSGTLGRDPFDSFYSLAGSVEWRAAHRLWMVVDLQTHRSRNSYESTRFGFRLGF